MSLIFAKYLYFIDLLCVYGFHTVDSALTSFLLLPLGFICSSSVKMCDGFLRSSGSWLGVWASPCRSPGACVHVLHQTRGAPSGLLPGPHYSHGARRGGAHGVRCGRGPHCIWGSQSFRTSPLPHLAFKNS